MDEKKETEKPSWFPVPTDSIWLKGIRDNYPNDAHMPDDELRELYNEGAKYENLWDHVGEAYEDYEKLADAYLELLGKHGV